MIDSEMEDVIEAFVDDEAVIPARLELALADAEGRACMIELLVLRGLVAGQPPLRALVPQTPVSRGRARASWLALAAGLAAASVFGGYAMGVRSTARQSAPATEVAVAVSTAPAPAPTQVIRLENGVDWSERGGGN
jgi:hypothetical protein